MSDQSTAPVEPRKVCPTLNDGGLYKPAGPSVEDELASLKAAARALLDLLPTHYRWDSEQGKALEELL